MSLRQRKPGAPRRGMTPAQAAANRRSFQIFRLRGLWSLAYALSPNRRAIVHALIDQDLTDLGAEPESKRHAERLAAWERVEARERTDAELEAELPF
jgi:hypothetical protein